MHKQNDFRDWSVWIKLIGLLLLLVGVVAAFIAPIETYTFFLFSEGGKFHYQGFGFGSFMFGNIAAQIIGYYAIALICIPLGYAHFRINRWARKITLTLLYDWLIFGLPLSIIIFLMLVTSKDPSINSLPFLITGFLLIYPVLPILLIRLYRSRSFQRSFQEFGHTNDIFHQLPDTYLILISLLLIIILALHIPLLFNGIFPFFGRFFFGLTGIYFLDISILLLALLLWGIIKRNMWSWWGTLIYLLLMAISGIISFFNVSPAQILENMTFPESEVEILQNVPVQGYHLALTIVMPILITLIFQIATKKHYWRILLKTKKE